LGAVVGDGSFWSGPFWLADGRRLLFSSPRGLYIVDIQTREVGEIQQSAAGLSAIAVSRDNRWVYLWRASEAGDVWMATLK
jgi:hypothetical protein